MDILEKSLVQSNPLVEARKDMTLAEMRLFCLGLLDLIPYINEECPEDAEFPVCLIPPSDIERLFNGKISNVAVLRRSIDRAFRSAICINEGNGSFWLRHIYEEMHYVNGEGLYIQFHRKLRPYLLDLVDRQYTKIKVKEIFCISSEYAWRLMELLQEKNGYFKQGITAPYIELSVQDLREKLNVPDEAYKGRMDNFRRKVLDSPLKEISDTTPYKAWYEIKKTGRRITGFKIYITKKNQEEKEKNDEERQEQEIKAAIEKSEAVRALCEVGVNPATAKVLVDKNGEERTLANLRYAKQTKTDRIANFAGYVVKCVEDNMCMGQNLLEAMKAEEKEKERTEREISIKYEIENENEGYEVTNEILRRKQKELAGRTKS